jgi:hypothetical protein
MKNLSVIVLGIGCVFAVSSSRAIDLKQSKVTQVVNDVEIISAADQSQKNASVNDLFKMPDILKTGPQSRAELVAEDETVTRVGANTIFSFDPANRTIDLKQGSLLFHSPHGKGGGTIHTGSATASVLGTTLIITTTPSGGFKVLDLEGSVEVNFLNGLNQKLAPGQMSFVLPGGNVLSPIVIFRLDDLTQNSKLVGGFHNQLGSMPLILQQVEQQLADIKSGKYSDTGLLVGSDGNSQGIQVIDPNTLQAALNAQTAAALKVDATISQSSLSYAGIPVPPERIITEPFLLPNNLFYLGQPFIGFAGKNIFFKPPGDATLHVDLSPYASFPEFDFVAAQNISFNGSVSFDGIAGADNVLFSLIAGNQILVTPGSSIEADVANFQWESPAILSLDSVNIVNQNGNTYFATGTGGLLFNNCSVTTFGNLGVQTLGDANFNGTSLKANTIGMDVSGSLGFGDSGINLNAFGTFTAGQNITLNGGSFLTDPDSGGLTFTANNGDINVSGTSFNTSDLSLISLNGNLTMNNAGLSNVGYLNAVANTITVSDTIFNPSHAYNFGTATGQANVNNGVTPGDLNLIQDSLGPTAITSASQVNMTAGPVNTPGINSYRAGGH